MPAFARENSDDKIQQLVANAKKLLGLQSTLGTSSGKQTTDKDIVDKYWQAYVSIEYAILRLKLVHGLDESGSSSFRTRAKRRSAGDLLDLTRSKLESINDTKSQDPRKFLSELREVRDCLKALVASYDRTRRSTTS